MAGSKHWSESEEKLHLARAAMAFLALLIAAAHIAYNSGSGFSAPTHPANSTGTGGGPGSGYPTTRTAAPSFNMVGFWEDVEIIAYTLIAVVFILGLRTWYPLSVLFNAFNLVIYLLSGIIAIPGLTNGAFASHLSFSLSLSNNNILLAGWVLMFILGFVMMKYDPGSQLDSLLVTKKK